MADNQGSPAGRRGFLLAAGSLAATPLVGHGQIAGAGAVPDSTAPARVQKPHIQEPHIQEPRLGSRRNLGALEVSSVGLGVQNMSRNYQTTVPNRPEMINIIRTAFERGVTFYDAAEAYGPHEVERILGEGVAPFRNQVRIATKFGWNIDLRTGERLPGLNSRPDHIRQAVEGMLQRLRTDRIDLLYQHRVDPQVPIEDVAGAVQDLVAEGKVLHWGLSEMGLKTLRRAHAALPLTAVQNEYSMLWRGPEHGVIALCEELGIGFVPWSPLGVGFLAGAIDAKTRFADGDIRKAESRFSPENLPPNLALVELLKRWAIRKQASPAQIALAWLMAQKPWIVPIPGTTQMAHMLDNLGADAVRFTAVEVTELNQAVAAIKILGARLPDAVLAFSGVEAPVR
jgi:aryl-alcohol dehydrogenase-like predicted oxidoreductase